MNIALLEKIAKNKLELWILFSQLNKTCNDYFHANNYRIQLDFERIISKYPCHNTIVSWYNNMYKTRIGYNNSNDIFCKAYCDDDKKLFAFAWRVTCIENDRAVDIQISIGNFDNNEYANIIKHYYKGFEKQSTRTKNITNNTMLKEHEYYLHNELQKQTKFLITSGRYQCIAKR